MTDNRLLASRWRVLAEEIFARADRVHDADIQEKIRGIAAGYERLAQRVEDGSGEGQRGAPHAWWPKAGSPQPHRDAPETGMPRATARGVGQALLAMLVRRNVQ
jgi:hypothetical protein